MLSGMLPSVRLGKNACPPTACPPPPSSVRLQRRSEMLKPKKVPSRTPRHAACNKKKDDVEETTGSRPHSTIRLLAPRAVKRAAEIQLMRRWPQKEEDHACHTWATASCFAAFKLFHDASDALRGLHLSCAMCPLRAVVRVNSAPHRGQYDLAAVPDFSR